MKILTLGINFWLLLAACMAGLAPHISSYIALIVIFVFLINAFNVNIKPSWPHSAIYSILALTLGLTLYNNLSPVYALIFCGLFLSKLNREDETRHDAHVSLAIAMALLPPFSLLPQIISDHIPSLLSFSVLGLALQIALISIFRTSAKVQVGYILLNLLVSLICKQTELGPYIATLLTAIPCCAHLIHLRIDSTEPRQYSLAFFSVVSFLAIGVIGSLANPATKAFVILPTEKVETSQFYQNYSDVLNAKGFKNIFFPKEVTEIPPRSIVIFPQPFHQEFYGQLLALKKNSAYESMTILVFGEHTNMEGIATTLSKVGAPILLNKDTTVPYANLDYFGGWAGLGQLLRWNAPLNRGASIRFLTPLSLPLFWTNSAHSEREISDDGRLGDYIYRNTKLSFPLFIAGAAMNVHGPAWVVIGDSTPSMSNALISDHKAFLSILVNATFFPSLIFCITLLFLIIISYQINILRFILLFFSGTLTLIGVYSLSTQNFYDSGKALIRGTDLEVYGDKSMGRALISLSPDLVKTGITVNLGEIKIPGENYEISIFRPPKKHWPALGIEDCVRVGAVNAGNYRIMDGVACRKVNGKSVIGAGQDTVGFIRAHSLTIMDEFFLSDVAPLANTDLVRTQIRDLAALKALK